MKLSHWPTVGVRFPMFGVWWTDAPVLSDGFVLRCRVLIGLFIFSLGLIEVFSYWVARTQYNSTKLALIKSFCSEDWFTHSSYCNALLLFCCYCVIFCAPPDVTETQHNPVKLVQIRMSYCKDYDPENVIRAIHEYLWFIHSADVIAGVNETVVERRLAKDFCIFFCFSKPRRRSFFERRLHRRKGGP